MSEETHSSIIHLVSFNIPYPPDYGGVMDVFYKITALKKQGVGIILHCFSYGRARSRTLEKECLRVYYYKRNLNLFYLLRKEPFIVLSRENERLLSNLISEPYPIIFEGLHTTSALGHPKLKERMTMVRTHNIEHMYYRDLAKNDTNPFRKAFFLSESRKLERYEKILSSASLLLTISPGDTDYFRSRYGRTLFVGPFHPADRCDSVSGLGEYILLHGDFSTPENNAAAIYLLRRVIPGWNHKTIIAGKRPSEELIRAVNGLRHVKVIPNPSQSKMTDLIQNAQVCLLNASQNTGMKLKLINALCSGRHIIASPAVVNGSGLESLCTVVAGPDDWIESVNRFMVIPFNDEMRQTRNSVLNRMVDNDANARKIIDSVINYDIQS